LIKQDISRFKVYNLFFTFLFIFWQQESRWFTLLFRNIICNSFNLWSINKGALHTNSIIACRNQHITTTNQLIGSSLI